MFINFHSGLVFCLRIVEFSCREDLNAAISKLDDTELGGRRIRIFEVGRTFIAVPICFVIFPFAVSLYLFLVYFILRTRIVILHLEEDIPDLSPVHVPAHDPPNDEQG